MVEKPELEPVVRAKLDDLQRLWEELESSTRIKAQCLFDANRAELFTQSCSALEAWLSGLQAQLHSDDYGKDLTSVNILLKKQQVSPVGRLALLMEVATHLLSLALNSSTQQCQTLAGSSSQRVYPGSAAKDWTYLPPECLSPPL